MSHREQTFCVCDGCGAERAVTSPIVPAGWTTAGSTVTSFDGRREHHYCDVCWNRAGIAIHTPDRMPLLKPGTHKVTLIHTEIAGDEIEVKYKLLETGADLVVKHRRT